MKEKTNMVIYAAGRAMAGGECWLDGANRYFIKVTNNKENGPKEVWDKFYCKKLKITVEEVSDEEFDINFVDPY